MFHSLNVKKNRLVVGSWIMQHIKKIELPTGTITGRWSVQAPNENRFFPCWSMSHTIFGWWKLAGEIWFLYVSSLTHHRLRFGPPFLVMSQWQNAYCSIAHRPGQHVPDIFVFLRLWMVKFSSFLANLEFFFLRWAFLSYFHGFETDSFREV